MEMGKICGATAVVLGAVITTINTYHGGEPLPIVAIATMIGLLEYALLK